MLDLEKIQSQNFCETEQWAELKKWVEKWPTTDKQKKQPVTNDRRHDSSSKRVHQ